MALIGDVSILKRDRCLAALYLKSTLSEPYQFVFYLGIIVLMFLIKETFISMYILWSLAVFSTKAGAEIADRLHSYYLSQGLDFSCNRKQFGANQENCQ